MLGVLLTIIFIFGRQSEKPVVNPDDAATLVAGERLDPLHLGMTLDEVRNTLGPPVERDRDPVGRLRYRYDEPPMLVAFSPDEHVVSLHVRVRPDQPVEGVALPDVSDLRAPPALKVREGFTLRGGDPVPEHWMSLNRYIRGDAIVHINMDELVQWRRYEGLIAVLVRDQSEGAFQVRELIVIPHMPPGHTP